MRAESWSERMEGVSPHNRKQQLQAVAQRFGIDLVYAFGSQAARIHQLFTETTHKREGAPANEPTAAFASDADIGVVFTRGLPPAGRSRADVYASLYNELADLVRPLRLDLVFLQENHSVFQAEAIKGYCLYAVNNTTKENFEEMVCRLAADFRPFLRAYLLDALSVSCSRPWLLRNIE